MNAALVSENASQIQKQTVSPQADYAAFVNLNGFDKLLSLWVENIQFECLKFWTCITAIKIYSGPPQRI